MEWNKKFNLTSITGPEEVRLKHFQDSVTLSNAYDFLSGNPSVIDIGTGAGFPGIPLKILYPNIKLTLLDSVKKKTDFLEHIIQKLGLTDISVIRDRAEDFVKEHREQYDVAVCRALAPLNVAVELCLPFVKTGGVFIAMKGKNAEAELKDAEKALDILGGRLERTLQIELAGNNGPEKHLRRLIVIKKDGPTPGKYPRKAGIPQKRPL